MFQTSTKSHTWSLRWVVVCSPQENTITGHNFKTQSQSIIYQISWWHRGATLCCVTYMLQPAWLALRAAAVGSNKYTGVINGGEKEIKFIQGTKALEKAFQMFCGIQHLSLVEDMSKRFWWKMFSVNKIMLASEGSPQGTSDLVLYLNCFWISETVALLNISKLLLNNIWKSLGSVIGSKHWSLLGI